MQANLQRFRSLPSLDFTLSAMRSHLIWHITTWGSLGDQMAVVVAQVSVPGAVVAMTVTAPALRTPEQTGG